MRFCSSTCETQCHRANEVSDAMERGMLAAPRLTKATRRGLHSMRALADVTADNGQDMTPQEVAELRHAIAWLDHQLRPKKKRHAQT